MARRYWLVKSEPDVHSFEHHRSLPDSTDSWDGVRNYQARNYMRDAMKCGDRVVFYHSNTNPPHAAGVAEIVREAYPDHTQWDPDSKYYDEKSSKDDPRWFMVDIAFVEKFGDVVEPGGKSGRAQGESAAGRDAAGSARQSVERHADE